MPLTASPAQARMFGLPALRVAGGLRHSVDARTRMYPLATKAEHRARTADRCALATCQCSVSARS